MIFNYGPVSPERQAELNAYYRRNIGLSGADDLGTPRHVWEIEKNAARLALKVAQCLLDIQHDTWENKRGGSQENKDIPRPQLPDEDPGLVRFILEELKILQRDVSDSCQCQYSSEE